MIIRYKYPKTSHLPWSESFHKTDHRMIDPEAVYADEEVVVTVKFDGENTSMYPNYVHARSVDSSWHESRSWVNRMQGELGWQLKENERICGENMYAEHSIKYNNLKGYFYVFNYWIEDECQSWDDTVARAAELGLPVVDVIYRGIWDADIIKGLANTMHEGNEMEGYVVRLARSFKHDFNGKNKMPIAKYVRKDHVQTDQHWSHKQVVANKLKEILNEK